MAVLVWLQACLELEPKIEDMCLDTHRNIEIHCQAPGHFHVFPRISAYFRVFLCISTYFPVSTLSLTTYLTNIISPITFRFSTSPLASTEYESAQAYTPGGIVLPL